MRRIESAMNGIARPRMVEGKGKQCIGRHARTGAAEAYARRRQLPQSLKRTGRRRRRFHADHYSAGTEASRSRIE
jgi:hypothetical protein